MQPTRTRTGARTSNNAGNADGGGGGFPTRLLIGGLRVLAIIAAVAIQARASGFCVHSRLLAPGTRSEHDLGPGQPS